MKKSFIFLAFAAFTVLSCSTATKIFMDSTSSEGERKIITTKQSLLRKSGNELSLSLGVSIKNEDTVAAVIAIMDAKTGHGIFNRGDAMKFRLTDGEEITLTNLVDKKYQETKETHVTEQWETGYGVTYAYGARRAFVRPYRVDYLVPEVYTTETNCSYAVYLITKQQFIDIVTKGVIKMRVEIEDRDIDLEKDDAQYVSEILKTAITSLLERINEKQVKTEF